MKCPLFVMGFVGRKGHTEGQEAQCLKEGCAWYRPGDGECCIQTLAATLDEIAKTGFPVQLKR